MAIDLLELYDEIDDVRDEIYSFAKENNYPRFAHAVERCDTAGPILDALARDLQDQLSLERDDAVAAIHAGAMFCMLTMALSRFQELSLAPAVEEC